MQQHHCLVSGLVVVWVPVFACVCVCLYGMCECWHVLCLCVCVGVSACCLGLHGQQPNPPSQTLSTARNTHTPSQLNTTQTTPSSKFPQLMHELSLDPCRVWVKEDLVQLVTVQSCLQEIGPASPCQGVLHRGLQVIEGGSGVTRIVLPLPPLNQQGPGCPAPGLKQGPGA